MDQGLGSLRRLSFFQGCWLWRYLYYQQGPSTHRSTNWCFPAMVWAPKVPSVPWQSMAQPVVLSIPSLSQVASLLVYLGVGGMPSGEDFSPVVAGGT